nr:S8 family serine peptidase [Micromonospora sp. RL09-050-HVF-A]
MTEPGGVDRVARRRSARCAGRPVFAGGPYPISLNPAVTSLDLTLQASAHVAGMAARVLGKNPTWTPAQVHSYLVNSATPGVVTNPGSGSPNRLLYGSPTL